MLVWLPDGANLLHEAGTGASPVYQTKSGCVPCARAQLQGTPAARGWLACSITASERQCHFSVVAIVANTMLGVECCW
jgi:hypothetical protein